MQPMLGKGSSCDPWCPPAILNHLHFAESLVAKPRTALIDRHRSHPAPRQIASLEV